ncbi:hypothetical protein ACIP97_13940 [Peribacillus frigoritolerans]|uniref:hypothetical protein n=1 Tax=Peribacillus frigoritolerans TaxID=450367 RepID=UPI003803922E
MIIGVKPYDINKTYVFLKHTSEEISEVGNLWIKDRKKSDYYFKGYFSSNQAFDLLNIDDRDYIQIIGYTGNKQYQLLNVLFGDTSFDFNGDFAAKFSFEEYKVKIVKN